MQHDLPGDGMGIGQSVPLLGEMRQDNIRFQLAKEPRQTPDSLVRHEQNGIVGAEKVYVLNPQQIARLARLFSLHVGPFRHERLQFIGRGHFAGMVHLITDDLIMHARTVRQHDTADIVAARRVMCHRPARLVENVGGMRADRKNS